MSSRVECSSPKWNLRFSFGSASRVLSLGFLLACLVPAWADDTHFYVDSSWRGIQTGDAPTPWRALTPTAWLAINGALATNHATIFFSAQKASLGADGLYDSNQDGVQDGIELTMRAGNSPFFLTFDGKSYYNTSETTPRWGTNLGTNMCQVAYFNSQNGGHLKYSNIIIHGFRIVCNASTKEITICGDNWKIENCDSSHSSSMGGVSSGPGILLVPTADGPHQGSGYYAPPCTNILIRSNIVHDTFGEGIYLGGGGSNPGEAGSGYPSHSHVTVELNTIYNAGTWGGQGDGIDVKGGIRNCILRGNNIYSLNIPNGNRGIVATGQPIGSTGMNLIIDRNFIHDCTGITEGIASSDTWGVPQGIIICNNIISSVTNTSGSGNGITIASSQDQVLIANNTICNCKGRAIEMSSTNGSVTLRNNLVFGNNANVGQVILKGTSIDSDFNAFQLPWGCASEGPNSLSLTALDIANALVSPAAGDFRPKLGALILGKASILPQFSTDYAGLSRGVLWDIGAFNYKHAFAPNPPTNLRILR